MRLEPRVDDERPATAPVLLVHRRIDAVNVGRGIRPRERQPEEVFEARGGEVAVIDDHDQRPGPERMLRADRPAEPLDVVRPRRRGRERPDRGIAFRLQPGPRLDPRPADRDDARQADAGIAEAVGQRDAAGQFPWQRPDRRSPRGDDELRTRVESAARVVERVDRGLSLKVAVAPPVDPFEEVREKRPNVVGIEAGGVSRGDDEEILRERELPLPEDRRGLREQFGRPRCRFPGEVALASHGQEQRMHARGVDRMHALHARQHRRDHRTGQFVDEPAEERVFLRRPPDHRDRPDRVGAVPDMVDLHDGEIMPPGVVAEMVAEGALRLRGPRMHRALDHEVGLGVDGWAILPRDHRDAMAGEHAGEREFGKPFRQRHHGRGGECRRAAHEDRHLQRLAAGQRRRMVHADAAMQLVVEADLAVVLVGIARQLDAVHAEVRMLRAGMVRVFGVNSRQGDERSAVAGPACHLRQPRERNVTGEHRARADVVWQH